MTSLKKGPPIFSLYTVQPRDVLYRPHTHALPVAFVPTADGSGRNDAGGRWEEEQLSQDDRCERDVQRLLLDPAEAGGWENVPNRNTARAASSPAQVRTTAPSITVPAFVESIFKIEDVAERRAHMAKFFATALENLSHSFEKLTRLYGTVVRRPRSSSPTVASKTTNPPAAGSARVGATLTPAQQTAISGSYTAFAKTLAVNKVVYDFEPGKYAGISLCKFIDRIFLCFWDHEYVSGGPTQFAWFATYIIFLLRKLVISSGFTIPITPTTSYRLFATAFYAYDAFISDDNVSFRDFSKLFGLSEVSLRTLSCHFYRTINFYIPSHLDRVQVHQCQSCFPQF